MHVNGELCGSLHTLGNNLGLASCTREPNREWTRIDGGHLLQLRWMAHFGGLFFGPCFTTTPTCCEPSLSFTGTSSPLFLGLGAGGGGGTGASVVVVML